MTEKQAWQFCKKAFSGERIFSKYFLLDTQHFSLGLCSIIDDLHYSPGHLITALTRKNMLTKINKSLKGKNYLYPVNSVEGSKQRVKFCAEQIRKLNRA